MSDFNKIRSAVIETSELQKGISGPVTVGDRVAAAVT
jgi:hypothetical protein